MTFSRRREALHSRSGREDRQEVAAPRINAARQALDTVSSRTSEGGGGGGREGGGKGGAEGGRKWLRGVGKRIVLLIFTIKPPTTTRWSRSRRWSIADPLDLPSLGESHRGRLSLYKNDEPRADYTGPAAVDARETDALS